MPAGQSARRVYSAEELHRLRGTCSQPRLREAIEQNDGEDAELVKEHVLRGSKSFAARSFRSRASGNSLRVPSSNKENFATLDIGSSQQSPVFPVVGGLVLGEIAPNSQLIRSGAYRFRPSPTPSLKRKKAEAIVKAHGSPQHVRVTAGGRIVPSEQSPLCHPRYGYSAIKTNGGLIKFAPNHPMGKAQWTQATQNGFVAQDVNGRLCQIVNGTILPLNEVDGALHLYIPAPNLNVSNHGSSLGFSATERISGDEQHRRVVSQGRAIVPPEPSPAAQANALELEYSKVEHELKDLDKTEVLHGRTMGKVAKDALFGKRRELVMTLDKIRKAIRGIKTAPPPDAPTSPRAMQNRYPASPPRHRLPIFLQDRMQQTQSHAAASCIDPPGVMVPADFGSFVAGGSNDPMASQFAFQGPFAPDAAYEMQPYAMAPPAMFLPPPSFDGSLAQPFITFQAPADATVADTPAHPVTAPSARNVSNIDERLPQTDGARSIADLQIAHAPAQSHALTIKAPDSKQTTVLKSTLNPLSPAYKPAIGILPETGNAQQPVVRSIKDRVPTPLSPLHRLRPTSASKSSDATMETISPVKKSPHVNSSSTSSFETADFFPRDTREYSTRKYDYPESNDKSEDKENIDPALLSDSSSRVPATPPNSRHPTLRKERLSERTRTDPASTDGRMAIASRSSGEECHPSDKAPPAICPEHVDPSWDDRMQALAVDTIPNRDVDNVSPKGKRREWRFVHEHPELDEAQSSPPEKPEVGTDKPEALSRETKCIDFSEASVDWIEGYRAGLARRPVGSDRDGDFLDGYCAGLLKSKPMATTSSTSVNPAPDNSSNTVTYRPPSDQVQPRSAPGPEPSSLPLKLNFESMTTLKEAVFAPHNEDAILTPTAETPNVNETSFNLAALASALPSLTGLESSRSRLPNSPIVLATEEMTDGKRKRHAILSEGDAAALVADSSAARARLASYDAGMLTHSASQTVGLPSATLPVASSSSLCLDSRHAQSSGTQSQRIDSITSMTSIDANLSRPWPAHRVFSPHLEWKAATSVAQAAGLASGLFANTQFDGAPQSQRMVSNTSSEAFHHHSRFREGSIDGISNSPNSPRLKPMPTSPSSSSSPSKAGGRATGSKNPSPAKPASPAKVKFEHIAEKVGIKVLGGRSSDDAAADPSPNTSPAGKRRWRDVWRSSARRDVGNEES